MLKSFISEHTAEYALVPQFAEVLNHSFKEVIPIFFWSTREGGIIAKKCLQDYKFLVVAMYARRPKVHNPNQDFIYVKFNDSLFLRTAHLQNEGIPVFAGVPLISTLRDFQLNSPCTWFKLDLSKTVQ